MAQDYRSERSPTAHDAALAALDVKHRRWQIRSEQVGFFLRIPLAATALAIALALILMAWEAWHSRGIVIESFHVPDSYQSRGLSGEVVANAIIDRLADMRESTDPIMPADTLEADWREDYRVTILQVGLSIGEVRTALRRWLSSDTRISGEIFQTSSGVVLALRSNRGSASFANADGNLETLATLAAEDIYRRTSPFLYARYLGQHGRVHEAIQILERIARTSPERKERARALSGLGNRYNSLGQCATAIPVLERAVRLDPTHAAAVNSLGFAHACLGHDQISLDLSRQAIAIVRRYMPEAAETAWSRRAWLREEASVAELLGDNRGALRILRRLEADGEDNQLRQAVALARTRDVRASQRLLHDWLPSPTAAGGRRLYWLTRTAQAVALEDWPSAARFAGRIRIDCSEAGPNCDEFAGTRMQPFYVAFLARAGRQAEAEAIAAELPEDCYKCAWARAVVAELGGDFEVADEWFERAVEMGPRLPFAYHEWGESLAARGEHARALEKFTQAIALGPGFADAYKGRGDALAALGRLEEAVGAYRDAAERAPQWGMLHVAWGRALWNLQSQTEAKRRLCAAETMVVPDAERDWLRNFRTRQGFGCPAARPRAPLQNAIDPIARAFSLIRPARSPTDFFRMQGDFARAAFDQAVAESARLSETVLKLAGDVAEPITSRYTVAAERVKTLAA